MPRPAGKKVLFISYHFPPSTAVGGIRIARFAKNLPVFGLETRVLTIKDRYLKQLDTERLKDFEEDNIYKTIKLPTLLDVYLRLKCMWRSVLSGKVVDMDELEESAVAAEAVDSGPEKARQRLKRYIASLILAMPDTEKGWILPAALRAVALIRREKIDCIMTSCPPYSVHLIGLCVKRLTGVRWIADFRDPWTITRPRSFSSALSYRIETWLEKKVVHGADMVLTNTERLRSAYEKVHDEMPQKKFKYVPNGIDTEVFSKLNHLKKYDRFTITYSGTLYLSRSPEPVFKAVKELILEDRFDASDMCIKLMGNCRYVEGSPIIGMVRSYGLEHAVELMEPVPYSKALEIIRRSHLALLLAPDQPYQVPAKLYDYIGAGTKILALTEDGATSDMVRSTNSGGVFLPEDVDGIKEFIYRTIKDTRSQGAEKKSTASERFDIRSITEELAGHIYGIL